jgi:hypothetical protein
MRHSILKLILPLAAAIVTGCADIATGRDSMASNPGSVSFALKSSDAISGSMNGTVPDEKPAGGQFF